MDVDRLDPESLRTLPTITKADLMDHFDHIVTDERLSLQRVNAHLETVDTNGYLLDHYTALTSGGSSGERGVFVYDWEGWSVFWLSCFRHLLRAKQSDPELASRPLVVAWVMAGHFTHATAALGRTFAGPNLVAFRFPVTLPTDEIVAGLNEAQPDALNAYPSALHELAFEARAGRLRINPTRVQSAAEPLLPEIRAAAEEAWRVPVGNLWGTSEGGGTAAPCENRHSHLSEDLAIVEAVDEHGQPVAPGERSAKVYLTNLYNRALPLIRYEITGRRAAIVEYQVRQTPTGAAIAVRCRGPVDLECLSRELEDGLARLGVEHPEVTIATVDRLERSDGPAKLKRFVPLPAAQLPAHRGQDGSTAPATEATTTLTRYAAAG